MAGLRTLSSLIALALATLALPAAGDDDAASFDKDTGYRIAHYRAPVPEEVPGATRIFFDDVERHQKEGTAILLDVSAAEGGGVDVKSGEWRLIKTRMHIPGSHWLPDVGKGRIGPGLESYFKAGLRRLTGGDKTRAVVIYCLADCWMGWNAAKRAASYGYTNVLWYPEGTDGWRDWDGRLVPATPTPMDPKDAERCVPHKMPEMVP